MTAARHMSQSAGAAPILRTRGLTKRFGGLTAVQEVDLCVGEGTIHGLIGPNGAGKTTCFNLLTKFEQPTSGQIFFKGADITGLSPIAVARRGLVRSFQISAVFPQLSVLENVRIALQRRRGGSFDFWRSRRALDGFNEEARSILTEVGLEHFAGSLAGELSYGRKRTLEIATTLALEPEMLLLDEPMAGMSTGDIELVTDLIAKLRTGRTILMVEHNLKVVSSICDRITVLTRGQILVEGGYDEVAANPLVHEAYMGAGDE